MAETTKETKAQRAKKYRTRRLLVGAAGLVLCVGVAFGIDGVVTARADSALADALAAATDLQVEQHQSVEQAAAEGRTAAAADLTAYVAEAGEKADAALQKAAEEAKKAKAAEEARKAAAATSTSTELPGGQKSSGSGRALTATKTGGNFKASVYNGNTGASNIGYYQSLNSDVKAWLKIPGTNINYPVLQNAYEDHYYLHRGLDRGQSYYGVLWTQTATQFGSADSLSSNTVIYGHNWKNCRWNAAPSTYYAGQQMFESLLSYHHTSWAEQYPYLYYSTPNEEMAFVIFACFYTEGTDWYINAEGNIDSVISGAKSRSRHNFGVDVNSGDKLITLSEPRHRNACAAGRPARGGGQPPVLRAAGLRGRRAAAAGAQPYGGGGRGSSGHGKGRRLFRPLGGFYAGDPGADPRKGGTAGAVRPFAGGAAPVLLPVKGGAGNGI